MNKLHSQHANKYFDALEKSAPDFEDVYPGILHTIQELKSLLTQDGDRSKDQGCKELNQKLAPFLKSVKEESCYFGGNDILTQKIGESFPPRYIDHLKNNKKFALCIQHIVDKRPTNGFSEVIGASPLAKEDLPLENILNADMLEGIQTFVIFTPIPEEQKKYEDEHILQNNAFTLSLLQTQSSKMGGMEDIYYQKEVTKDEEIKKIIESIQI